MKVKLIIDSTVPKEVTVELETPDKKTTIKKEQSLGSQVLLPTIIEIIQKNKLKLKDITEIQVNQGPGSFTGTRVGVSVANALGFALKIPVNGKLGKIVEPVYDKSKFDI